MDKKTLVTKGLTKLYPNGKGCENIDISVSEGEVFGLLGPNGAGKSTLVKTLVGLLQKTSGDATVLGHPIGAIEARRHMGYLPELFKYQDWMTGRDLLRFHAQLYKIDARKIPSKMDEVLQLVHMKGSEQYKIGTYSKGMQQRIGLASALLCDPKLIFLDEPTSALDPIGRKEVRDIILKLKESGKSVFLNSHLLGEVEQVCDAAAIISHGKVIRQGDMKSLLSHQDCLEIELEGMTQALLTQLGHYDPNLWVEGRLMTLQLKTKSDAPMIARQIVESGAFLYSLKPKANQLEALFVQLIEKGEETCGQ